MAMSYANYQYSQRPPSPPQPQPQPQARPQPLSPVLPNTASPHPPQPLHQQQPEQPSSYPETYAYPNLTAYPYPYQPSGPYGNQHHLEPSQPHQSPYQYLYGQHHLQNKPYTFPEPVEIPGTNGRSTTPPTTAESNNTNMHHDISPTAEPGGGSNNGSQHQHQQQSSGDRVIRRSGAHMEPHVTRSVGRQTASLDGHEEADEDAMLPPSDWTDDEETAAMPGTKRRRQHTVELWNARRSEFENGRMMMDPNRHSPDHEDRSTAPTSRTSRNATPSRSRQSTGGSDLPNVEHRCHVCGVRATSMWRRGPKGPGTLCNSCGIKHMLSADAPHGTAANDSADHPADSWGDRIASASSISPPRPRSTSSSRPLKKDPAKKDTTKEQAAPTTPVGRPPHRTERNAEGRVILSRPRPAGAISSASATPPGATPPNAATVAAASSSLNANISGGKKLAHRPHPKLVLPSDRTFGAIKPIAVIAAISPGTGSSKDNNDSNSISSKAQPSAPTTTTSKDSKPKSKKASKKMIGLPSHDITINPTLTAGPKPKPSATKPDKKSAGSAIVRADSATTVAAAATPGCKGKKDGKDGKKNNDKRKKKEDLSGASSSTSTSASSESDSGATSSVEDEDPAVTTARLETQIRALRSKLAFSETVNRDLEECLAQISEHDATIDDCLAFIIREASRAARRSDMLSSEPHTPPPSTHPAANNPFNIFQRPNNKRQRTYRPYRHVPLSQYPPIHDPAIRKPSLFPDDVVVATQLELEEIPIVLDFCKAVHTRTWNDPPSPPARDHSDDDAEDAEEDGDGYAAAGTKP
ncbi:hypothetical protein DFJ77DRAFT_505589 [Powellomyces hirtus]|nr:hypothetical protein DFJ77DRAFT_505589 [Powellomyces hirtus]